MTGKNQSVRGTHDLYGDGLKRHQVVLDLCQRLGAIYGFEGIQTPIFEHAGVFHRTLGDTSDIVGKETYTFQDRGGDELTLRPEGTASVVRALLSNGLTQSLPLKFMYAGPMFRYERPQKGRYRQFHQVGVEYIGLADPYVDVECIALGVEILNTLGIKATLTTNTLGDLTSRSAYRNALVAYLQPYEKELSADSQLRLLKNPLRILDSKDPQDQAIVVEAPKMVDFLTPASQTFYEVVQEGLTLLGIPAQHNPYLVRGLDYYCHTAFEIVTDQLGAQGALIAGGRYDGLVATMGGPQTPAFGWALGVERIASLLSGFPASERPLAIIPVTDEDKALALQITQNLRHHGCTAVFCYGVTMGKRLKMANKVKAKRALIFGPDDRLAGQIQVKDLDSGTQFAVDLDNLISYLLTH